MHDTERGLRALALKHWSALEVYKDFVLESGLDIGEYYEIEEAWEFPAPKIRKPKKEITIICCWSCHRYMKKWRQPLSSWKEYRKTQYKPTNKCLCPWCTGEEEIPSE
jgi:hypothetical protein